MDHPATCTWCGAASAEGSRILGFAYSTLCDDHRRLAVRKYQPIRPTRSKSNFDYSDKGKR